MPTMENGVALHLIIEALLPGSFKYSMAKRPPFTMQEFQQRSKKYVNVEDSLLLQSGIPLMSHTDAHKPHTLGLATQKYQNYAPLIAPPARIYREVMYTEFKDVQQPPSLRKRSQTDKTNYCEFLMGHGHSTDDCIQLRDTIEQLVRGNCFSQYIKRSQPDGLPVEHSRPRRTTSPDNERDQTTRHPRSLQRRERSQRQERGRSHSSQCQHRRSRTLK